MEGAFTWTDTARTYAGFRGDLEAFRADLARRIRGEVRFRSADRALYATDASNYRQVPLGVIIPRDAEDVVAAVAICREHAAPITHRGAGTSLAGQTTNDAVIIDTSKYLDRILEVDPERRIAVVEPGVRRDQLARATEPRHGLTFGPDTSTHEYATFGGMIGNNACGVHSELAGCTVDNVEALEILTYDGTRMSVGRTHDDELERIIRNGGKRGEIYARLRSLRDRYATLIRERYPQIPRRISGYNLDQLLPENGFHVARALVGSEGTLVTILAAAVRLVSRPRCRVLLVLGYEDIFSAGDHLMEIKEHHPTGLEGLDDVLVDGLRSCARPHPSLELLPEGRGWLLVEFGGDSTEEASGRARALMDQLAQKGSAPSMRLLEEAGEQHEIWEVRESGLAVTARTPDDGDTWPGWEDSAVPPERMGEYMRELKALYEKHGYRAALYGHFGQGCVHSRINFDLGSPEGLRRYRSFIEEASDLCIRYGGSLSAEHGDGQARAEMLPRMYGTELVQAFREFKEIWDPDWKMNPGKVVDPYRIDENLRLGADFHSPELETHFQFPDDDNSFYRAALRCVGVGKCRRHEIGAPDEVMCPSFLVTREEMHTTRGRARLLFEMLRGDETPDAWDNDDVHEALDLCLACKGCKSDCPVNVDMATYKAEFLAHYYRGKVRPRSAYALGLIHWWAQVASRAPSLVNTLMKTPGLAAVAKRAAGISPHRSIPSFAEETFRSWYSHRRSVRPRRSGAATARVILWADTFNNFFRPQTARAAVAVLEAAGCEVVLPQQTLCCGRPLYDYGMLGLARRMWLNILEAMRDEIRAGTPVVGLEPSCVAAFRDELVNMLPDDPDARRLSEQTLTLAEFLVERLDGYEPPRLHERVLVHGHCHHKAIMGLDADRNLLQRTGADVDVIASSCCGMAGAFGFEAEHYEISIACAEKALLPAIRTAGPETILVADGFSCREQIGQTTGRHALHLAELLAGGLDAPYNGNGWNPRNRPASS